MNIFIIKSYNVFVTFKIGAWSFGYKSRNFCIVQCIEIEQKEHMPINNVYAKEITKRKKRNWMCCSKGKDRILLVSDLVALV